MISVLIPVYNTNVYELVAQLSNGLKEAAIEGEIIVIDDASESGYQDSNSNLNALPFVTYHQLQNNIGRLAIRNLLCAKAKGEWLLFLDSDCTLPNHDFLHHYIQTFSKAHDVIVGGRVYPPKPACTYMLHWLYGSKRESRGAGKTGFHTNNFCIKKSLFGQLRFDQIWKGYGHEDTWVGIQLHQLKASILYIDNAVVHTGLETSETFLRKTKEAVHNLVQLSHIYNNQTLKQHVTLYRYYGLLKKFALTGVFSFAYQLFKNPIQQQLLSCNPSLFLFDLYRLNLLIQYKRNYQKSEL